MAKVFFQEDEKAGELDFISGPAQARPIAGRA
jgi:hypothetical protein